MAKHRGTVFAVVRVAEFVMDNHEVAYTSATVLGVYLTAERADEIKAGYEQQMKDYGFDEFQFEVQASTYYDE
jgi:hypothetical protein